MVQQYHKLCTKLLSVGNSLEAVVMPVFVPVYGSAHIHAVLYRVPARIWLCNNTQFWVRVVHGNSLSALFWFDGVPVGKVGRHQVVLLPWSTRPEFMWTFATAWPPASAWSSSSSSPVLFFLLFLLTQDPFWGGGLIGAPGQRVFCEVNEHKLCKVLRTSVVWRYAVQHYRVWMTHFILFSVEEVHTYSQVHAVLYWDSARILTSYHYSWFFFVWVVHGNSVEVQPSTGQVPVCEVIKNV